jgi:MFS family permease
MSSSCAKSDGITEFAYGMGLNLVKPAGETFNVTNPLELTWLVAGYSLTAGTFILFSGRLGDLFGYKRLLTIGFAWFSLWSMISGVAVYSNRILFIFARVVQGIGPAIVLPNGLAILGSSYPPGGRKNMVFSCFAATAATGAIIGTVFAGLFELAWWPWVLWFLSIVLAVISVLTYLFIPDELSPKPFEAIPMREKLRKMDLPGAIAGITALVLINFAWNQAPIVGWEQAYVYVCLIIGILLVGVFFYIELRLTTVPLIPFEALNYHTSFVLACVACGWGTFGIWSFYSWQTVKELRQHSSLSTAAQYTPVAVAGAAAAITTGIILTKAGPAYTMVIAMAAFLIGIILVATLPLDQIYWGQLFVALIVTPFGMDMSFPAATVILSDAVPKKHQGIAASLVATIVNYSISLGLGFGGTVEVQVNNGGKTTSDRLSGFRGAEYVGIGLSSLGLGLSLFFVLHMRLKSKRDSSV